MGNGNLIFVCPVPSRSRVPGLVCVSQCHAGLEHTCQRHPFLCGAGSVAEAADQIEVPPRKLSLGGDHGIVRLVLFQTAVYQGG